MNNLRIEDFTSDNRIINIFKENNYIKAEDIVYNLELYKFLDRSEIVDRINNHLGCPRVLSIDTLNRSEDFSKYEKQYKVLIGFVGSNELCIVADMFSEIRMDSLEIDLSKYKLSLLLVTPMNYKELTGVSTTNFNYNILIKRIVMECITAQGTDIHFTVKHVNKVAQYLLEFRVNNKMVVCDLFDFNKTLNKDIIFKTIHHKTKSNTTDLDSSYGVTTVVSDLFSDGEVELRVTASKCFGGYHCVIRVQKLSTVSKTVKDLGFLEEQQQDLIKLSRKLSGFTIIAGPVRSGKNTTQFALANELIKRPLKIIDYSSPIEVLMPFTQVDYLSDVDYLLNCIRLSKKQDINVVFINEIPDKEVALAVRDLVNSSIHVISTFHLDRLWHLPHKLYEYYDKSFKDVLTQINGVVTQKMFIKQCKTCAEQTVSSTFPADIRKFLDDYQVNTLYVNKGCPHCDNGRLKNNSLQPYVEILVLTDEIKSELLKLDNPYQMELYLKGLMRSTKRSLEYTLAKAIRAGDLDATNLYDIL